MLMMGVNAMSRIEKNSIATSKAAIGDRLRRLRLARELTQQDIAVLAGMSPQAWNNNENGRDRIGLDAAMRLCLATGASLDWLYFGITWALPAELFMKIHEPLLLRNLSTSSRARSST